MAALGVLVGLPAALALTALHGAHGLRRATRDPVTFVALAGAVGRSRWRRGYRRATGGLRRSGDRHEGVTRPVVRALTDARTPLAPWAGPGKQDDEQRHCRTDLGIFRPWSFDLDG